MQIEIIPETALTSADDTAIAALLARAFSSDFGGRSFFHQRHHLRLLARDPGIVGHVALTLRAVRLGDALIDIAGLAEVATDPARRGEGIAARLLAQAIEAARQGPAAFVLLFGDAQLYHAAGFRPATNPIRHVVMSGARTGAVAAETDGSLMALPLNGQPWDATAPLDLLGHLF